MGFTNEREMLAKQIDTRVTEMKESGATDLNIFLGTRDLAMIFQELKEIVGNEGLDELKSKYRGLYLYTQITEYVCGGRQQTSERLLGVSPIVATVRRTKEGRPVAPQTPDSY